MATARLRTITPVDGSVYVERELAGPEQIAATLERARLAQADWKQVPISDRAGLSRAMVDAFVEQSGPISEEISWQMGRPSSQAGGEVRGFEERARYMIEIAAAALAEHRPPPRSGFERFIRRQPLGVVLTIAPWNYPYLTAVNSLVPAIMAFTPTE